MQSNEMDFALTPSLLETPSLMTPNILQNNTNSNNLNPFKSYGVHEMNVTSEQETLPNSNPPSIPTTVTNSVTTSEPSSSPSGDVKVSRIEDDLKKSIFTRLPTPSPFATIATANGTGIASMSFQTATENTSVPEVPSTADVKTKFFFSLSLSSSWLFFLILGRSCIRIIDKYICWKVFNKTHLN